MAVTPDNSTLVVAESYAQEAHGLRHRRRRRPLEPPGVGRPQRRRARWHLHRRRARRLVRRRPQPALRASSRGRGGAADSRARPRLLRLRARRPGQEDAVHDGDRMARPARPCSKDHAPDRWQPPRRRRRVPDGHKGRTRGGWTLGSASQRRVRALAVRESRWRGRRTGPVVPSASRDTARVFRIDRRLAAWAIRRRRVAAGRGRSGRSPSSPGGRVRQHKRPAGRATDPALPARRDGRARRLARGRTQDRTRAAYPGTSCTPCTPFCRGIAWRRGSRWAV